jgi:hypothetical protein
MMPFHIGADRSFWSWAPVENEEAEKHIQVRHVVDELDMALLILAVSSDFSELQRCGCLG